MTHEPMIHVVEDDAPMRDALLVLFASVELRACGYGTAEAFLERGERSGPLCLVADVRLPGMNGLALHRHLVSLGVNTATIIITGHGDIAMAVAALKAGARDFVTKPFDPSVLLGSVRDAFRHAQESGRRKAMEEEINARLQSLTPRELAILNCLVEGSPSKVIAADLGISIRTIEHHRAHIMEKMGVRTLSQLIRTVIARTE